jgi:hypothetical protein
MNLFHISETPNIARFDPRPDENGHLVVWAIDIERLPNYLLPRDCPRVCARRTRDIPASDVETLLAGKDYAIYVEERWRERISAAELFCYVFDSRGFECVDDNAGYYQSGNSVIPLGADRLTDLEKQIASHGVALCYVDSLWPIRDRVVASTLAFSCIRMHNTQPRTL